jgi:DNA-binding transcriptional MerR regulator
MRAIFVDFLRIHPIMNGEKMTEYFMPISELAKKLDLPAHTLRYWEKEFPSVIAPTTGAGGRRFYRPEVVSAIIALKKYLYSDGYTIDGVKKLIASGGFDAGETFAAPDSPDAPAESALSRSAGGAGAIRDASVGYAIDLLKQALTDLS